MRIRWLSLTQRKWAYIFGLLLTKWTCSTKTFKFKLNCSTVEDKSLFCKVCILLRLLTSNIHRNSGSVKQLEWQLWLLWIDGCASKTGCIGIGSLTPVYFVVRSVVREPSFSLNEINEKASRYFSKSHLTNAKGK